MPELDLENFEPEDALEALVGGSSSSTIASIYAIDITTYATSGSGTLANPYDGWGSTTFAERTTYFFRTGQYYKTTVAVNWAKRGIRIIGNGATILCVGAGYVGAESAAGAPVYNVSIRDLVIKGDGTTTVALRLTGLAASWFQDIVIGDCVTTGVDCRFVLTSFFVLMSVSPNSGIFSTMPADGFTLRERGAGTVEDCIGNAFIACAAEGLSGKGFNLVNASTNMWFGGTSESNAYGVYVALSADNQNNMFSTMHMEGNSTADIYCLTGPNNFENCRTGGAVKFGDSGGGILAFACVLKGGRHGGTVTVFGDDNTIDTTVISGTFVDLSTTTNIQGRRESGIPFSIVGALQTSPHPATTPAASAITGLGAGGTATFATRSSDLAGEIILTTTTAAGSSGTVTVTLVNTFVGGLVPALQLCSGSGAWDAGALQPRITAKTTNSFTIAWTNNSVALSDTTTYIIGYHCIGRR